ncbi:MAG TPA: hypothetical protein VHC22_04980 [Pirellulales bacterium]|nr:hypothetical protein [Pirellulales bacterium]
MNVFRLLTTKVIDVRRLSGLIVVAFCAAWIFGVSHYVLDRTLGADAAAVHPSQRPLGWALYERMWGRVAAVDRLYQRGQLPPDTRLGVFIGVSTTAAGIQRRFLDAEATAADRWIVLSGAGLSFENIENVMHPVFFCGLKPTVVALGVHPQMLVGERYLGDEPTAGPLRVVGRRRRALESHFASLGGLGWLHSHWAVKHRGIMGHFLRSHIYTARLFVFYMAGVTAERLATPAAEPWDEDPLWLWNMDDAENQFAQLQMDFWHKRGHFEPENYDPNGAQARCIVRMISAYRELGAKVVIFIMPLRSTTRKILPPNAKPCLYEVLRTAFPDAPPTVIDFEKAIPDRLFTDEAHLTKNGADRLSKMVAEKLKAGGGL